MQLSGCYNLEAEQLQRMFHCCHNLRSLDLSFSAVEDHTILVVEEFCPHLQSLNVSHCSWVTQCYLLPLKERGVEVIESNERSRAGRDYRRMHMGGMRFPDYMRLLV